MKSKKRKRGRPPTPEGENPVFAVRLPRPLIARIDAYVKEHPDHMRRWQRVAEIIEAGLKALGA